MQRNVGGLDALIRAVVALGLVAFGMTSQSKDLVSFAAILAGLILMGTALTRECPVYRVLRRHTTRAPADPEPNRRT